MKINHRAVEKLASHFLGLIFKTALFFSHGYALNVLIKMTKKYFFWV